MRHLLALALPSLAFSKFIAFGDWGTGSTLQKENAANINAHCAVKGNCDFVVGLADNFYNGVSGTHADSSDICARIP